MRAAFEDVGCSFVEAILSQESGKPWKSRITDRGVYRARCFQIVEREVDGETVKRIHLTRDYKEGDENIPGVEIQPPRVFEIPPAPGEEGDDVPQEVEEEPQEVEEETGPGSPTASPSTSSRKSSHHRTSPKKSGKKKDLLQVKITAPKRKDSANRQQPTDTLHESDSDEIDAPERPSTSATPAPGKQRITEEELIKEKQRQAEEAADKVVYTNLSDRVPVNMIPEHGETIEEKNAKIDKITLFGKYIYYSLSITFSANR